MTLSATDSITASSPRAIRLKVAAGASAVLAFAYLLATPTQLERWVPYGGLFLVLGLGQARLAGALLRRPGPATLLVGIWANLAVIGLYVGSRTVGLPFGPVRRSQPAHLGEHHALVAGGVGNGVPFLPQPLDGTRIETVGDLVLSVVAVQFAVVVILVSLLGETARRWTTNAMGLCGLGLWVASGLGVLG